MDQPKMCEQHQENKKEVQLFKELLISWVLWHINP